MNPGSLHNEARECLLLTVLSCSSLKNLSQEAMLFNAYTYIHTQAGLANQRYVLYVHVSNTLFL